MNNKPTEISIHEWREIMLLDHVNEGWGLDEQTSPEEFSSMVYGAKFHFVSGSPGYVGDLFILQGDTLEPPIVIIRKNGALQITS